MSKNMSICTSIYRLINSFSLFIVYDKGSTAYYALINEKT